MRQLQQFTSPFRFRTLMNQSRMAIRIIKFRDEGVCLINLLRRLLSPQSFHRRESTRDNFSSHQDSRDKFSRNFSHRQHLVNMLNWWQLRRNFLPPTNCMSWFFLPSSPRAIQSWGILFVQHLRRSSFFVEVTKLLGVNYIAWSNNDGEKVCLTRAKNKQFGAGKTAFFLMMIMMMRRAIWRSPRRWRGSKTFSRGVNWLIVCSFAREVSDGNKKFAAWCGTYFIVELLLSTGCHRPSITTMQFPSRAIIYCPCHSSSKAFTLIIIK